MMATKMRAATLSRMLRESYERHAEQNRKARDAVDEMALAVPHKFVWPPKMAKAYSRAIKILK